MLEKDYSKRLGPTPDYTPLKSIEIVFGAPVYLHRRDERILCELIDSIVKRPYNQFVEGVHWVSEVGSKPNWSVRDAILLGRDPGPEAARPEDGGEPTFDDGVLQITTTARPFVSEKERQRVLSERKNIDV